LENGGFSNKNCTISNPETETKSSFEKSGRFKVGRGNERTSIGRSVMRRAGLGTSTALKNGGQETEMTRRSFKGKFIVVYHYFYSPKQFLLVLKNI